MSFRPVLLLAAAMLLAGCQSPAAPASAPEGPDATSGGTGEVDFSNLLPGPNSARLDLRFPAADGSTLTLDMFYPQRITPKMPFAVYVHSGGWYQGDKSEMQGASYGALRQALVESGVAVAAINYRLSGIAKFPAQAEDVRAAIRFLTREDSNLALDPHRMALVGASAGGHLATLVGLMGREETAQGQTALAIRPRALVSLYGVHDLEAVNQSSFAARYGRLHSMLKSVTGGSAEEVARNNPAAFVSPDDPPVHMIHGDTDNIVPASQSETLHQRLTAAGVKSSLTMVKDGVHGFSLDNSRTTPDGPTLVAEITGFLTEQLRP